MSAGVIRKVVGSDGRSREFPVSGRGGMGQSHPVGGRNRFQVRNLGWNRSAPRSGVFGAPALLSDRFRLLLRDF